MERPFVSLENDAAVYDFFTKKGPDSQFMEVFHRLSGKLFPVHTVFAGNTRQVVGEHLAENNPALVVIGHATWLDPVFAAASLENEAELQALRGNISIPGNAPYFNKRLLGWIITKGGAIPAFRVKDVFGKEEIIDDDQLEVRRKAAAQTMIDICVTRINNGGHIATFAESTRNRGDRRIIQPLKKGPIWTIEGMDDPEKLMVVTMTPYYGNRKLRNLILPTIGVDYIPTAETPSLTLSKLQEAMQNCLDFTIAEYDKNAAARRNLAIRLGALATLPAALAILKERSN
jgi:1-acyl-sn-glycerol-3-phosphate acyltransferase